MKENIGAWVEAEGRNRQARTRKGRKDAVAAGAHKEIHRTPTQDKKRRPPK